MIGLLEDPIFEQHDTGTHPEKSARLRAIRAGLEEIEDFTPVRIPPTPATLDDIALVHDRGYIEQTRTLVEQGTSFLDADTQVCRRSYEVALQAVGGSLKGLDAIMEDQYKRAFFAVRPPGHHAEADRSMGFCLFNNVAIGAEHLRHRHGLDRVAIYDFDVHHGNGTMHSFYDRADVFYGSVHQWPFYPGTGRDSETGTGAGQGTTLNLPQPSGAGDAEWDEATRRFSDAMDKFKPQALLISAGFDAHWSDPLAGIQMTEQGFCTVVETLLETAQTHCEGRLAMFLEGGYNLHALRNTVSAVVKTLLSG